MGDRSSSITRTRQSAAVPKQEPQALFDTHAEVSLDFEVVRQAARQKYTRPFLILDTAIVRNKIRRLRAAMPRVRPHYAVKANPDRRVLKVLVQEGAGFEIASTAELDLLLPLGVPPAEVFFSNPMKSRDAIAYAAAKGVEWYVVDSVEELRRVHEIKPDAKQYLRIATPNIGADWPLSGKFGCGVADAREIIAAAARLGATLPASPSTSARSAATRRTGGSRSRSRRCCSMRWPRPASSPACSTSAAASRCGTSSRFLHRGHRRSRERGPEGVPGGGAGHRRARALPRVRRRLFRLPGARHRDARGKRWMHWDAGLFGGVIESSEGLRYRVRTDRSGPDVAWTVGGPTCDSVDVVMRDEPLPSDLQEGDFIYIQNAGAYTTAYASQFNGFPLPEVRVFESKT